MYNIPKQLFLDQGLFDLVKEAKRVSGRSESYIYREGARRYAAEIVRGASEREAVDWNQVTMNVVVDGRTVHVSEREAVAGERVHREPGPACELRQ
jgi:hypothetical protein